MAVISNWLSTKPSVKPMAMKPTIWLAETLVPNTEPATPHHGMSLSARK